MDFNKFKQMGEAALNSGGSSNTNTNTNTSDQPQGGAQNTNTNTQQPQAGSSGQEDYGDKGLDFLEKKAGYSQSRETNEKITDGARGLFEKATGKNIDAKYSN